MKLKTIFLSTMCVLVATGCATNVKPAYVSPTQYQGLACNQLHSEYARINQYIENGVKARRFNSLGLGIGLGGGWGRGGWGISPTVSVNMGQTQESHNSELAQVMGQRDAIAQAAQFKNCPIPQAQQAGQKTKI